MGASAVDGATWTVADAVTRTAAAQLTEALQSREVLARLAHTYRNAPAASRAGHLFEALLAHDFNTSAIRARSQARAVVSEFAPGGSQSGADDLRVILGGKVTALGQAKLMGSTTAAASEVARAHYQGMGRYVPSEQLAAVESLLDRRLGLNPDGLRYDDYADARTHLADRITADGVSGKGVSAAAAHRAAHDVGSVADAPVVGAAATQILGAGLGAAASSVLIDLGVTAAGACSRGESLTDAVSASLGGAARAAVLRAGVAAGASAVQVGAVHGPLPDILGAGGVPFALARASADVATIGLRLARGEVTAAQAAGASALAVGRPGLVWAFSTTGQTLIPVPVVGGLVGAAAAQVTLLALSSGFQMAAAAATEDRLEQARVDELIAHAAQALEQAEELAAATEQLAESERCHYANTVAPLLAQALSATAAGLVEDFLADMAGLTAALGGTSVFCTSEEFELAMKDEEFTLALNPNSIPRPRGAGR